MRILIDECLPRALKRQLVNHECSTVQEMGWSGRKNGELLSLAEMAFDVFLSIDQSLEAQQNLRNRRISVLILEARSNQIEDVEPLVPDILSALAFIQPTQVITISRK